MTTGNSQDASTLEPRATPPLTALHLLLIGLVAGVAAIFGQTIFHEYGLFDDDVYVTQNPMVLAGLTWRGIGWAFTTAHAANWHPLTWLSLMLDTSLAGANPLWFHATNVALHAVNAVLLFLCLRRLAALVAPAPGGWARDAIVFLVTAFWAWHPLRVESVAWIAERKDVLATCFGLLALHACVKAWPAGRSLPWTAWVYFVLGCMAKPTLVMVPATLGLLAWLMGVRPTRAALARLGVWCAVSLGVAVITVIVQHAGGAIQSTKTIDFPLRLGNAFVSVAAYVCQTVWPAGLAPFYPYEKHLPAIRIGVGILVVLGLVLSCLPGLRARIRGFAAARPAQLWAAGVVWFLVSLVPVLGFVQVGGQARADRYTYWSGIGLAMAVLVFLLTICATWPRVSRLATTLAATGVLAYGVLAFRQTAFWRTTEALVDHTVAVCGELGNVRGNLGAILAEHGRFEEAIVQIRQVLAMRESAEDYANLANALVMLRRLPEARQAVAQAVRLDPGFVHAWALGGLIAAEQGEWAEARQCLAETRRLIQAKPADAGQVLGMVEALDQKLSTHAGGVAPK